MTGVESVSLAKNCRENEFSTLNAYGGGLANYGGSYAFAGSPVRPIIRAQPEDAEALPYLFWKEAMAQASGKELWQ